MSKRKRVVKSPIGEPYDIIRVRFGGVRSAVYCCTQCPRAWKLPEPVENWRIKTLLSHSQAHRVDDAIEKAIGELAGPVSADLPLPFPKDPRRKRKSTEKSKVA